MRAERTQTRRAGCQHGGRGGGGATLLCRAGGPLLEAGSAPIGRAMRSRFFLLALVVLLATVGTCLRQLLSAPLNGMLCVQRCRRFRSAVPFLKNAWKTSFARTSVDDWFMQSWKLCDVFACIKGSQGFFLLISAFYPALVNAEDDIETTETDKRKTDNDAAERCV